MKKRFFILSLALSVVVIALAILPYGLTVWGQNVGGQQRVIEIEVAKNVIEAANRLTGLNELENVRITAERVVLKEDEDDSPVPAIRERVVGHPLWRVTYTGSFPEWQGKRNPDIQAFDVLLDAEDLSLLKIASKWAEDIDPRYKEGARISRKHIATLIRDNHTVSETLPKTFSQKEIMNELRNGIAAYIDVKHIEWYYFYVTQEERDIPVWLRITHGGPPPIYLGPPIQEPEVIPDYVRVARVSLKNALTGELLLEAEMLGTNTEDF